MERIPYRINILRFRHLLQDHQSAEQIMVTVNATLTDTGLMLRDDTVVDATLIAAPSSPENRTGERDPEMHQAKMSNQWKFGLKALQGLPAKSMVVARLLS